MKQFLANATVRAIGTAVGVAALTALAFAWPPLSETLKAGHWPGMVEWSSAAAGFVGFFVSALLSAVSMLFGDRFSGSFTS